MGKTFFLVWLTFNANHTTNVTYMGGHEYASAAYCNAISEEFNKAAEEAMQQLTEEELPEMEYACTTIAPDHTGMVRVMDNEALADDPEFFIKAH